MAQQELESAVAEMARAAAILFHEGRMPVSVTVCYSDGSAWQPSLGCESLGQGEWEPVLARTLHSALDRTLQGQRRLVCVTLWFSDKSGVQFYAGSGGSPEAGHMDDLSQCKQAITRVLHDVNHRLTTNKVIEELQGRNLLWGESTVKRALAEMVREGELNNRRSPRPRGYGLPGWH